jgi:hypothetical protein
VLDEFGWLLSLRADLNDLRDVTGGSDIPRPDVDLDGVARYLDGKALELDGSRGGKHYNLTSANA